MIKKLINFKSFGMVDISLIKLSVSCSTFFLISMWSGLANWVINTHWSLFLIASLIFAIKPIMKVFN